MRVGVVSPLTNRGIGIQSYEAARNLNASVLFVETKDPSAPSHPERAPFATKVRWAQGLDPKPVRNWLRTVDVVYAVETFYDPRFTKWARANDTRTVLHANPEFWTGADRPDMLWTATPWRMDTMPPGTEVVPFPVATDRFNDDGPKFASAGRKPHWLHVAGKRALADRNGTDILAAALPHLTEPCVVRIAVQHGEVPPLPKTAPGVEVYVTTARPDYWTLYAGHDALVMPRRYGGLCLPVQEAMAAGLAVLMPDVSPNDVWPTVRAPAEFRRKVTMPCGRVPMYDVRPEVLASMMDQLADPEVLTSWQNRARAWAQAHSWETLAPVWRAKWV